MGRSIGADWSPDHRVRAQGLREKTEPISLRQVCTLRFWTDLRVLRALPTHIDTDPVVWPETLRLQTGVPDPERRLLKVLLESLPAPHPDETRAAARLVSASQTGRKVPQRHTAGDGRRTRQGPRADPGTEEQERVPVRDELRKARLLCPGQERAPGRAQAVPEVSEP